MASSIFYNTIRALYVCALVYMVLLSGYIGPFLHSRQWTVAIIALALQALFRSYEVVRTTKLSRILVAISDALLCIVPLYLSYYELADSYIKRGLGDPIIFSILFSVLIIGVYWFVRFRNRHYDN